MNYQVEREFSGRQVGAILADSDFISARRAQQLVEMRYLSIVADADDVSSITGGTVAQMRQAIAEITDTDALKKALAQEERASAKRLLTKRLGELQNA